MLGAVTMMAQNKSTIKITHGPWLCDMTEDAVTVTSVLIPWNTCGMTQATILNVSTFAYLPYCVFNYVSPLMSILVAATGFKIYRTL